MLHLMHFLWSFAGMLGALLVVLLFSRPILQWTVAKMITRLMSDRYPENILEMVTAFIRVNPIIVAENSLRAETGEVIKRPFGSPRKFLGFDGLVFSPAQLAVLPTSEKVQIDTRVTIGPKAAKPLTLDIPILIGAIGYGAAVSESVKRAIAKGAAAIGTASNTGEGGFLPEERAIAKHLIVQYSKAQWTRNPDHLKQADAIEIHIGQGATASAPIKIRAQDLPGQARGIMGLSPGKDAIIPSRHPEIEKPEDLEKLVQSLRKLTGGVPIGIKMVGSHRIEQDLEIAVQAGVDFISIDGAIAGTKGGPPILEDDFGLPAIFALSRTVKFLKAKGVKDRISVLAGGGFFTPGDCLKAIALGADAVYMGTAPLWAMTHTQVTKTIPFEPPTQLVMYTGEMADQFDEEEAAYYLRNFLQSCTEEMATAVLVLGKTAVSDVDASDLVALDDWTSRVTGVPVAIGPEQAPGSKRNGSAREERDGD
jgi:glutamate synthase domain-containing protein 2